MKVTTKNEKETTALAAKIAAGLKGGEVLALTGELGSGKTTFTQGLAKALGVTAKVNSPTFVVLKAYKTKHRTIKRLVHIDAYRLSGATALAAVGWDDFQDPESVVVIEWADKAAKLLPRHTSWLKFVVGRAGRRTITVKNFPDK